MRMTGLALLNMATNEKGEVVTKLSEQPLKETKSGKPDKTAGEASDAAKSGTPAESEKGQGDCQEKAPVPLLESSDDKASDSDGEPSQRRRPIRKGVTKVAGDGSKSGDEGREKTEVEGIMKATPSLVQDVAQDGSGVPVEVVNGEAGPAVQRVPLQEIAIDTDTTNKIAEKLMLPMLSPGRIMKARKSFPSKKARGLSADDDLDDDDEDSIEEYVALSDQAESEDAFEMVPHRIDMPDMSTSSDTAVDERSTLSEPEGSLGSESSSSVPSTNSGKSSRKVVPADKQSGKKSANAKAKNQRSHPERVVQLHVGGEEAMDTGAASRRTIMNTAGAVDPLSAGTSNTKSKSSVKASAKDPGHVPEQPDQEQMQTQSASEPVAGTAAESQLPLSGTSTPVADFPVGNAGSMIPDSTAIAKGMPVKRSTRQRKPTHFGQHVRRKRSKNVSDSDHQSEGSVDAARFKKVRRSNGIENTGAEHSYARRDKQGPVALTLPDSAGDYSKRGLEPPLCCCKMEQARPATVVATTCEALEVVKGNIAVCGNKVESMTVLRPSTRIPYRALCPDHRVKMIEHKCCPGCGCFCSTGTVMSCTIEKIHHTFHKECIREIEGTLYCPHCGDDATFAKEIKLPITPELEKMKTLPGSVLLSYGQIKLPRALLETLTGISGSVLSTTPGGAGDGGEAVAGGAKEKSSTRARISSSKKSQGEATENGVAEQSQENTKKFTLKNGIVITTASLPAGPSKDTLEKALDFLDPINPRRQRFHPKNLYMASTNGEVDKVLQMLSEGFDPNYRFPSHNLETPLHGAASKGHLDIICLLLQSGANIDAVDANLATPLHSAADNSHLTCVQYLVTCGANVNHKDDEGSTVLHISTKNGNMEMLGYLLTLNKIDLNLQDNGGWTPVIWGADYKNAVSVRYLLEHGADPFVRDKEQNIGLHWAAYSGCQDVMEVFLNNNKDNTDHLNALNVHGDTPLHISARENHYGCAMQLLVRHADVTIKNNENELALDCSKPKSDVYLAIQANIRMKMAIKRRNIRSEVILSRDIAHGLENIPIPVVNSVNDDGVPTDFLYVKDNCETSRLNIDRSIKHMQGCSCADDCFSEACACSRSSVRCWYDKDGRLMPDFNYQEPPMIFECNRSCRCWTNCRNRVVQKGLRKHMQVFRSPAMGWAVRVMQDVPRGSFICEYAGELLSDADADQRQDDSYLFDLDNREGDVYCIDARFYGNVSRFINHRCDPNIVPVRVYIEHQDLRFPRIAFFASKDIRAYEELGFDYGDKFWAIKSKFFVCGCGASICKHKGSKMHANLLMAAAAASASSAMATSNSSK
ncbi:histone-lysine N-methyltransferase EHMT2-like isoform X2 [Lytechinus variegatus]|uniref:histone-lysine N-methyltransferase EHMT2-like isoform X2 n=1 Tax=Lytechinus variegatus TaxID=7654 RepID=UPI001BB172F7|nr:histone-lysine N-methyltransferase EHMT2-like isoform X2 [Lytechinus variegatus]